jgi:hypothetical protein
MRKCSKWFYKSYKNIWNKVMFNKVGIKGLFEIWYPGYDISIQHKLMWSILVCERNTKPTVIKQRHIKQHIP